MPSRPTFGTDPWSLLNKYRERYDLDSEIPGLMSLKMSLDRRRARRAALNRRLNDLANQLEETTSLLKAVNREIEGTQQAGAILSRMPSTKSSATTVKVGPQSQCWATGPGTWGQPA